MAYTWSTTQTIPENKYGNVSMKVNIFRGEITGRTETTVSFKFGVTFKPVGAWTSNSIAAYYFTHEDGTEPKYAFANPGVSGHDNSKYRAEAGTNYYAHYDDRDSLHKRTSESLCFSFYVGDLKATTDYVNITIGVGWNDWAGTRKGNLTFKMPIDEYHGPVGKGTVSITDNYNNTFSITGKKGTGVNNTSSQTLSWGYSTSYGSSVSNPNKLTITTPANAKRTVYAKGVTTATYGADATITTSKGIKQYVAPGKPGVPYIVQYDLGDRLTADISWDWCWEAAKPANDSSPVRGYRIRLYKNGTLVKGLSVNKSTSGIHYLVKGSGTNEYIDYEGHDNDVLNTKKQLKIENPAATFGFKAGDTVKLGLFAYSKNGLNEIQWSAGGQWNNLFSGNATSQTNSSIYTIENKGIMNVKVGGSWKEGQVYIKVGGAWKEAQGVYTKVSGSWKEST
jgi:hypothetical protein